MPPDTTTPLLGAAFDEALLLASDLHRTHLRKGTSVPYVSHLMSVAALVLEDEAEAIAALLHDALEDCPDQISPEKIERRFGRKVRDLVVACTDAYRSRTRCTTPARSSGTTDWWARRSGIGSARPGRRRCGTTAAWPRRTGRPERAGF